MPQQKPTLAKLLLWSHLAIAALTLLAFAVVVFVMYYRTTCAKVESELLGLAEVLSQELQRGVAPQALTIPEVIVHRLGPAPRDRAFWVVYGQGNQVLASHGEVDPSLENEPQSRRHQGKHPYHAERRGRQFLLWTSTSDGGQLLVGRPMAKEFDEFFWLAGYLVLVVAVGLLVSGLLAIAISRRIAQPIETFALQATQITHRHLDERLETEQVTREMTTLALSFNQMLDQLQAAFTKQRQFTSDAAHELRTPIAVIASQCDLSLSKPREADHYRNALGTCRDAASHMQVLVDQLLQLARLGQAGSQVTQRTPVDLCELTRQVVRQLQPLAMESDIELNVDAEPNAVVVANATQMRQLLFNVIRNAIQFSHPKQSVEIYVARQTDQVLVTVQDHGIGIAADQLQHICDRFYQVEKARTTSATRGVGLGLSIASEIVAAHQATLEFKSQPEEGTEVCLRFPLGALENRIACM
ncbi:sensor histidine kinase [Bremerella cremea]|nr:HAMP domain-containing sensor histidine kinase [Bremerella cremea]